MQGEYIIIDNVQTGQRLREVDTSRIEQLADSMRTLGQLSPIIVFSSGDETLELELVAGAHRLAAAQQIGWDQINAYVFAGDHLSAELAEIDENLCRVDLTPTQEAEHLAKRKAIWQAMKASQGKPDTMQTDAHEKDEANEVGADEAEINAPHEADEESERSSPTLEDNGRGHQGFATETADKTGKSKRTINQAIRRTNAICQRARDLIRATELDTGVFLDELADQGLGDDEQVAYVEQALQTRVSTPENKAQIRQQRKARKQARNEFIDMLHDTFGPQQRDQAAALIVASGGKVALKPGDLRDGGSSRSGVTGDLMAAGAGKQDAEREAVAI